MMNALVSFGTTLGLSYRVAQLSSVNPVLAATYASIDFSIENIANAIFVKDSSQNSDIYGVSRSLVSFVLTGSTLFFVWRISPQQTFALRGIFGLTQAIKAICIIAFDALQKKEFIKQEDHVKTDALSCGVSVALSYAIAQALSINPIVAVTYTVASYVLVAAGRKIRQNDASIKNSAFYSNWELCVRVFFGIGITFFCHGTPGQQLMSVFAVGIIARSISYLAMGVFRKFIPETPCSSNQNKSV